MKVNHILRAQALRLVHRKRDVYIPDVVATLRERYGFVSVPTKARELLPAEGEPLTLAHGRFSIDGREVLIQALNLYAAAINVETATSTDDADVVLEDVLQLGADVIQPADGRHHYASQLEVDFESTHMEWLSPVIGNLGVRMAELVASYDAAAPAGAFAPAFRFSALHMATDPTQFVLACDFRIERRERVPFSANVYFAQAPLRTADHIAILQRMDEAVLGLAARPREP